MAMGLNEVTTFSFISPKYFDKIKLEPDSKLRNTVVISNPLGEDTSVMRTTVIPSVCEVLARNYSYRNPECYIFEMGNEYIPVDGETLPSELLRLGFGVYDTGSDFDFYNLKGIAEGVLEKAGVKEYEITRAGKASALTNIPLFIREEPQL